jgi:hypothetical protein
VNPDTEESAWPGSPDRSLHHASAGARATAPRSLRAHSPLDPAERVTEAVERQFTSLDNPGFCLSCGADAEGCEPDAQQYECESCGAAAVYGAEEILIAIA